MFGDNPIRKQVKDDGSILALQEIFYTIQGEGPFAGTPAVFVRLAGCNLACTFCDTDFESNIDNKVGVNYIVQSVLSLFAVPMQYMHYDKSKRLVVLTGGEPMRQNIVPLLRELIRVHGFQVQIETAGTVWPEGLVMEEFDGDLSIVCSPKTGKLHQNIMSFCEDYKYIISAEDPGSESDGLPIRSTQGNSDNLLFRPFITDTVWLQAMDEQDEDKNRTNLDEVVRRCMKYGYRLSLQQHKILGLP